MRPLPGPVSTCDFIRSTVTVRIPFRLRASAIQISLLRSNCQVQGAYDQPRSEHYRLRVTFVISR
jgi:hypothetical protein